MFKVSSASLQTFIIDTPNCVLEDRVQYSTVHVPNVFCDGRLQRINCVGIVLHCYRQVHRDFLITLYKHMCLLLMVQLVEALRYKPEGRGFDYRWCHWNISLTTLRPHYGPVVDSASNRNEYLKYFLWRKGGRCVGLTTLPPSCVVCLEIREPQPPGTLRACPGL